MSLVDDFNIKIDVLKFYENNDFVYFEVCIAGDMFDTPSLNLNLAKFNPHPAFNNLITIRQKIDPVMKDLNYQFEFTVAACLIEMFNLHSDSDWLGRAVVLEKEFYGKIVENKSHNTPHVYQDLSDYRQHWYFTPKISP